MSKPSVLLFLLAAACAWAAEPGGRASCVGGTLPAIPSGLKGTIHTTDPDAFIFETSSYTLRIPYARITSVEYGQDVNRRVVLAWVVSPLFLLSKARAHFVTLHFTDESGKHEAIVWRVDKRLVRAALATLEAKTGRPIEYQDADARKFRHS